MEFAVSEVSVQVDCCAAHVIVTYSAYGTKIFSERPFKIQKNGVFLFEISFFRFRDIDIFIMQIRSVMMSYYCH